MHSSNSEISQGVYLRNKVLKLVKLDSKAAYKVAKSIIHPWYRCQSLAVVAENMNGNLVAAILDEAMQAAMGCHDANRRVTVACWPLHVALQKHLDKEANGFLSLCMKEIRSPMDVISRWCAVDVLWAIKSKQELLDIFLETFVKSTSKGHGWRVERAIKILLQDSDLIKDQRYIQHLNVRRDEIAGWKAANSVTKFNKSNGD